MASKRDLSKEKWISVDSSNLARLCYRNGILGVEFKSGTQYIFLNVPKEEYDALLVADSKGKYFNAFIKDIYEYEKIKEVKRNGV